MTYDTNKLLDWLEAQIAAQIAGQGPARDLLEEAPSLTVDDAYRLQFALMRRRAQRGDRRIGYKTAYTSVAMQQAFGMSGPAIGTLMQSLLTKEEAAITLSRDGRTNIEPEIAVLLKRDLAGPGVTVQDAVRAIDGYLPAIEVAPPAVGGRQRSRQMGTAVHKSNGNVLLGGIISTPRTLDLRLEGAVVTINGKACGSGTAVEVLGDPLNAVVHVANLLGQYGEKLEAGMIVMTGSVIEALAVRPGDSVVVEFARLGRVQARFA
jgi:2-keto-4-pentenoate hydratase